MLLRIIIVESIEILFRPTASCSDKLRVPSVVESVAIHFRPAASCGDKLRVPMDPDVERRFLPSSLRVRFKNSSVFSYP